MITNGSHWPIEQLDEKSRLADLKISLCRVNHKSAKENGKFLSDALNKEIHKGWELVLPLHRATEIPGLVISPMGVAEQWCVSATGEFVPKKTSLMNYHFLGHIQENQ